MKTSQVFRRIFGWKVGDHLEYLYSPSTRKEGVWLKLRVVKIDNGSMEVEIVSKELGFNGHHFSMSLSYVNLIYPEYIREYTPRKRKRS